jgi:hypothetical protein
VELFISDFEHDSPNPAITSTASRTNIERTFMITSSFWYPGGARPHVTPPGFGAD